MLMAFPGAILPVWGYHLSYDFVEVGRYFLALILGVLCAVKLGDLLVRRRDVRTAVVAGCLVAGLAFVELALTSPPAGWVWRFAGTAVVGLAVGLLNSAAFQSLSAVYRRDPAATVNLAGAAFGFGCLAVVVFIWLTYWVYTPTSLLLLLSLIPLFAAALFARSNFSPPAPHVTKGLKDIWAEVKSPGTVLFTLLLFFQFGNEWSVAGWLPVLLVHRVGANPATGLLMLAFYWFALLVGRVVTQALLARVSHGTLLLASVLAAIFGAIILATTNNLFGCWTAILLLGGGFATIYPLVVERIGSRLPDYHPGFFNGLLSIGITGGLLAPWCLGYLANWWGIRTMMVVPLLGSLMVFLLVVLLWIESKLVASPR
jgi:fucose permease